MRNYDTMQPLPPGSNSERERELVELLPLVRLRARQIYHRLPPNAVDFEDLCSAGKLGLMEAFARFDPTMNVPFAGYANVRIRGAILDSLRQTDWAPRELRRKARAVKEAVQAVTARVGRTPSEDEVASHLMISVGAYRKLLNDLDRTEMMTLQRMDEREFDEETASHPGQPSEDQLHRCIREQTHARITAAIQELPERERQVTKLFYYEELTQREIGRVLGKSGARVAQIRQAAVHRLRQALWGPSFDGGQSRATRLPGRKSPGGSALRGAKSLRNAHPSELVYRSAGGHTDTWIWNRPWQ